MKELVINSHKTNNIKSLPNNISGNITGRTSLSQHIVMVDGNDKQRAVISDVLKTRLHYSITELATCKDAQHYLQSKHPEVDLILLDLSSVEGGFAFIAEARNAKPDIPIIVLVRYGDYQEASEALLLGVYDFLTKPTAEERISVTLRNAIQLRNARRETQRIRLLEHAPLDSAFSSPVETLISLVNPDGNARKIEEIELAAIRFAIRFYNGRMTEVARRLGIGRSTLYRKLSHVEGAY